MLSSVIGCVLLACAVGCSALSVGSVDSNKITNANKSIYVDTTNNRSAVVDLAVLDSNAIPGLFLDNDDIDLTRYFTGFYCYFYSLNTDNNNFAFYQNACGYGFEYRKNDSNHTLIHSSTLLIDGDDTYTTNNFYIPYSYNGDYDYGYWSSPYAVMPSGFPSTTYIDRSPWSFYFNYFGALYDFVYQSDFCVMVSFNPYRVINNIYFNPSSMDSHLQKVGTCTFGYDLFMVSNLIYSYFEDYYDFVGCDACFTDDEAFVNLEFYFNQFGTLGYMPKNTRSIGLTSDTIYNYNTSFYPVSIGPNNRFVDDNVLFNQYNNHFLSEYGFNGQVRYHNQLLLSNNYYSAGYNYCTQIANYYDYWCNGNKFNRYAIFELLTMSDYSSYQDAYDDGYSMGYVRGEEVGYNNGFSTGNSEGYSNGYDNGYRNGLNENTNTTFLGLFGAVADTPILMLRSLFDFDLFGVNILTAVLSLITGMFVVFLVRKFI